MSVGYQAIIKFWFEEIDPKKWWVKDPEFDQLLIERFSAVHAKAAACVTCTVNRL